MDLSSIVKPIGHLPIDPDRYAWKQSNVDPFIWQRQACGAEVPIQYVANKTPTSRDYAYAWTTAEIKGKYTMQELRHAARAAWRLLRYQEPQIAATRARDVPTVVLQYQIPKDEKEIDFWLDLTVNIEASSDPMDFIMRATEGHIWWQHRLRPQAATIFMAASTYDEWTPLTGTTIRIAFQVDHLFFDGVGIRAMITAFFRGLVAQLITPRKQYKKLDWEKSVQNLREAYVKLLTPEQYGSETAINASVQDLLRRHGNHRHRYLLWMNAGSLICRSNVLWHSFTKEQSRRMIKAVQRILGPGYAITHLGHAAVLLAHIKLSNQRSSERQRCACGYIVLHGLQNYYPMYKGADIFPNTLGHLMTVAKQIKEGCDKVNNLPHTMAVTQHLTEPCYPMTHGFALPVILSCPSGQVPSIKLITIQMFTSYGIEEQYIPRHFKDRKGEVAIKLNDLRFWSENSVPFP
ncbi:MAG: hypothetical protein Q9215_004276 [Flavoplaca cf. flavocitrina]